MNQGRRTILFVDDETCILRALHRQFMDGEWELLYANGGPEALKIMEQTKVDMVVSDFRMPEMDGAEFLLQVKKKYPETIRLLLSGYISREAITQTLIQGGAHQFLAKPWNEEELKEMIRAAFDQGRQLSAISPGLQRIINTLTSLPELPARYHKINGLINGLPEISIDRLAEAIQQDVSLAADLLRWANSALFGQMQKVYSVKRAILVIGVEIVKGLILMRTVNETLLDRAGQDSQAAIEYHQQHSMACAVIAKLLASDLAPKDPALADQAFTAGLLHDVGLLFEIGYLTAEFHAIGQTTRQDSISLLASEEQVLHTNHAEIGGHLARWWSLPPYLVSAIRWHHAPSQAVARDQDLVAVIHVADSLAYDIVPWSNDLPQQGPPLDPAIRVRFSLSDERLGEMAERVRGSLDSA